jgi:hypothetical protein
MEREPIIARRSLMRGTAAIAAIFPFATLPIAARAAEQSDVEQATT